MLDEKLSALIDGELQSAEVDQVLSRVRYDAGARSAWERMCIIRSAIRSEDALAAPCDFAGAVMAGLDAGEPESQSSGAKVVPLRRRWNRSIAGFAVAASVVAAVVLVVERPPANESTKVASNTPVTKTAQERTAADTHADKNSAKAQVRTASAGQSAHATAVSETAATEQTGSRTPGDTVARAVAETHNMKIAQPSQVFDHDTRRISQSDWSRLSVSSAANDAGSSTHTWELQSEVPQGLRASNSYRTKGSDGEKFLRSSNQGYRIVDEPRIAASAASR